MNQLDLTTNSNHEPIRLNHYFFILPNLFIHPKNETKSALGKGRTWSLILGLETLCLFHYTTKAIATRIRPFYRTHFSLIFLLDTFQFDLFIGHISICPFPGHFSIWPLSGQFSIWPFSGHFSIWPFSGHYSIWRFSGHLSIWPFFRTP